MIYAGYREFNWNRYIDLAEELSDSDDEAKCRCGISRAYYGAFHRTKKFLTEFSHQTINIYHGGVHKEVIKSFEDFGCGNKDYSSVAQELIRLKKQREQADYNDVFFGKNVPPSLKLKKQLEIAIERAKHIVQLVDKIEQEEKIK